MRDLGGPVNIGGSWMAHGVASVDIKVRYSETDQMGIAYYGHYVVWFEVGRTHYMEEHGLPYRDIEARAVILPVSETYYRLIAPARYGDVITVDTWLSRLESRRVTFGYRVRREQERLAHGWTSLMSVTREFRPLRIPDWIASAMGPELGSAPKLD